MHESDYAEIVGPGGRRGYIVGPSESNPGEVAIAWDDGRELSIPASSLHRAADGSWRVERISEQQIVPVLSEELNIRRRKRETGTVRVGTETTEHQETVSMPLTRDRAHVRRVIIDKQVDRVPPIRREGDTIILPVVEEVAVVEKRLILKEELHVSRSRTTEQHEQTVTLREEHPAVERIDSEGRRTTLLPQPQSLSHSQPSILDPTKPRKSILGNNPTTRPPRKKKIL